MPTITDLLFNNGMSSMAPGGGGMSSIQSMLQSLQGGMNPLARGGPMQQAQDANPGTPFDPWAASRAMAANPGGVTADGPNVNSANPSFIGAPGQPMPFYMGGGQAGGMGQPKPLNAGPAGGTDWSNLWMQIMSGMGGMGGGGMQGGMGDSMPILQAIRSAMGRMPGTAPGASMGGAINSLMRYR